MNQEVFFIVLGEPASKSNSRRLIWSGRRPRIIKSAKALSYLTAFQNQCPKLKKLMDGDLLIEATIYYASRRPDLDESLILDAMQGLIYKNDRQIKKKIISWGLDREKPRAEIRISLQNFAPIPPTITTKRCTKRK